MPLFDYRCVTCGSIHEALVSSAEADQKRVCPACDGNALRKTVSRFQPRGIRSRTDQASLGMTGRDFLADHDKFAAAMDTFGESIGNPLTAQEKERAVERLKNRN